MALTRPPTFDGPVGRQAPSLVCFIVRTVWNARKRLSAETAGSDTTTSNSRARQERFILENEPLGYRFDASTHLWRCDHLDLLAPRTRGLIDCAPRSGAVQRRYPVEISITPERALAVRWDDGHETVIPINVLR